MSGGASGRYGKEGMMAKDKRQRRAEKGAKRVAKFADELRYKLDKYRLDDQASALIDRVLGSVEELQRYQQELADRPAAEGKASTAQSTD